MAGGALSASMKETQPASEVKVRQFRGRMSIVVTAVCAILPLYSIFYVLQSRGLLFQTLFYRTAFLAIFLLIALTLVFLLYPATRKAPRDRLPWYDLLLILAAFVPTLYEFFLSHEIADMEKIGATPLEQVLFIILLLVLFEGVRRTLGLTVLAIIAFSLVYAKFAYLIPGLWGAPQFSWERLAEFMYLYDSGIFGMILGIAATTIILFVTFGAFLLNAGTAKFMMDAALAVAGRWRGGPAKVAILGSAMMATMSGSATANVGTTGAITIPLMKRLGYKPHFAAAVETVASTGGAITPPVMGSIAFIMADITGLGYFAIVVAAILPALLYYICLYFQLDFEAAKLKLVGMPREELPSLKKALREGWHLLLPIFLLIGLLVMQFDVRLSVLLSIVGTIIASSFRKETRMNFGKIVDALSRAARAILVLAPVMAAVGVIFGAVTLTGLSINLSTLIRDTAGGHLWLLAILTWLVVYISGMGIGETVVYIVLAIIVAPVFVAMDVPVLAAHLFIFFAGVSMFITPPNCPAVFVACSIAGSNMWRTAFQSMRLGIIIFLLPFMILFYPVLILEGPPGEIIVAFLTMVTAAYFLAAGIEGYLWREASWWQRLLFAAGAICLFIPGWVTDLGGLSLILIPTITQFITRGRTRQREVVGV
jgi:TRAP transporter 4TM/12TM fusion protein